MLAYMLLRSALLATIEAPEARYTLECFPMVFALGGVAIGRLFGIRAQARKSRRSLGSPRGLSRVYRLMYCVFESVLKVNASPGSDSLILIFV